MTDRPILKLIRSQPADRVRGSPRPVPRARGPGRQAQYGRFQAIFDHLRQAFATGSPAVELRRDPAGIAPERALVFETAGGIQNFARAARELGLEVYAEIQLEETEEYPDGFQPPQGKEALTPTFYATMPTVASFEGLLRLWNAYERGEAAPRGQAPWWQLFDLLISIRPWGPVDRFSEGARAAVADQLPFDDDAEAILELELWPTANIQLRERWRRETEARILALRGRVIDSSSIHLDCFAYEALLVGLRCDAVRMLIDNPEMVDGLATLEGIQFILPQTIAQAPPILDDGGEEREPRGDFDESLPIRAVLFDGTPVAAHPLLADGLEIEDIHDLVRMSLVEQRHHATSMASLILRGDIAADGRPLAGSRLLSVPILIDSGEGASSPRERLLVDLVHVALTRVFRGADAVGQDVFVVNLSIGSLHHRFSGGISPLAKLLDWWAWQEGVLFVISAGNIPEDLQLPRVNSLMWDDFSPEERRKVIREALRSNAFERSLLSPAEALNGITVGALSNDLADGPTLPDIANVFTYGETDEHFPAISSALGLGPRRCIKPDLLASGGIHEFRMWPSGGGLVARNDVTSQRTGLNVASPQGGVVSTIRRARGTSCAAALVTRAIVQSAESLTSDGGPYEGQELPRRDYALLTRALAINSAQWPNSALAFCSEMKELIGGRRYQQANQETARYFGHGVLSPDAMRESPHAGATLVGFGDVRKDRAVDFEFPLPESLSGELAPRTMRVTIAWFSPVNPARAGYRVSSLEAIAIDAAADNQDKNWLLSLKSNEWDSGMTKRGSVWSRRLIHKVRRTPAFADGATLKIRVQCNDPTNGGLDPDLNIRFALAATLQMETELEFDVHQEIQAQLRLRLRGRG